MSEEAVVYWKSSGRFVSEVLLMVIAAERESWGNGGGAVLQAS